MPDTLFNRSSKPASRRDPDIVRAAVLLVVVGGVGVASLLSRPQAPWFWYAIGAVYLAVAGITLWAQRRRPPAGR